MTPAASPSPKPSNGLREKHLRELLTQMTRIRRFEERCAELYSGTKIRGFLHLYIGEEAVAVGVMSALAADDRIVSTYREHGHALARGVPMSSVMAEMYGRSTGCSRGRGGSMHLFDTEHGLYGGNAIVGGGLPLAIGLALADRMSGRPHVTVCFFGDGALAEGEFHESMNLAALWSLPVLFACENNLYAMGTALRRAQAQTDLALRATAYGMPAWPVDGMNVLAVERATERAVEGIRSGGGPCFLELQTYRFRAHSMYDAELYREKAEVAKWKERDPIDALVRQMEAEGLPAADVQAAIEDEVTQEIDRAVASAEKAPLEPVEDLTRFVYAGEPAP
ncbi:MAG TPA: pyruvate dehydrogenase (acetyl-transferring) E1 component subunit alpha [Dermatophilaceae bacterium]|nr:pyruvate dehydrogenase (acetyl-transferring) E1 component subunit alpha [Dermatophilaceae bacterium]